MTGKEKKTTAKKVEKTEKKEHKAVEHKQEPKAEHKEKKEVAKKQEKVEEKKPVVKAELKQAHFATAQELLNSGVDTSIIFYPLITEKAVGMIESQNKLCFIVSETSNKTQIKKAIETMYGVKVDKVNIVRDMKARKKAIVKLNKKFKADEIAMKLGVI